MVNIYVIIAILFIHWIADFVCQTDWQAKNKSKNNEALLNHVGVYTGITVIGWSFIGFYESGFFHGLALLGITFICHFITDYFTSRLNSKLWASGKVHEFFVSVGFDQFLHFTQLIFTYYILINW